MTPSDSAPAMDQAAATDADLRLVAALRAGDEAAFQQLLDRYQPALLRIAQLYVAGQAAAEDVVQETWLAVLRGLDNFAGRSSLKTWIFRILTNRAKTRGERDGRTVPFAALSDEDSDEPTVSADQFHPGNDLNGLHGWISTPHTWEVRPEDQALRAELRVQIQASLEQLPPTQRTVISLRDIEGWSAQEVCNILAISESNQRVLLHRARAGVRRALDAYLQPN